MSCKPFLKWVGGKTSLLPEIVKRLPQKFDTYHEIFLGGGALWCHLDLRGKNVVLNDSNKELINCWRIVRDKCETLIEELKMSHFENSKEQYLKIRALDRDKSFEILSDVEKAARFIFLNRVCFNGLYRVNSKGQFNTPFGKYDNPNWCNEDLLRKISDKLLSEHVKLHSFDYRDVLENAIFIDKTFVYIDPPYDAINETSNFTSYTQNKFDQNEQITLSQQCKNLNDRGVKFLMSNSDTPLINDLYSDFIVEKIQCKRSINCNGNKRGKVNELLIRNYD